jgi:prepilin-type N-terminal cleavage/methylation domain-containing protein
MQSKGFTLIELIITISILAVLVAILVVALNPAEQLARARDTKRVADLDAMKTALNLYLAQATGTPNMSGDSTANSRCTGGSGADTFFMNTAAATATIPAGFVAIVTSTGQGVTTGTAVTASSWLPASIGASPGGSPLASLPLDPTNGTGVSTSSFYGYGCRSSNKTFELTARLESTYFTTDLDLDGTDGGNSTSTYETGTDLTIVDNAY